MIISAVSALEGTSENSQGQAYKSEDLTPSPHVRFVDPIETWQHMKSKLAYRLGTLERPSD